MKQIFQPWRLGLFALSGLLGALAFPLAVPFGSREELFASGVLEPLAFVCLVPALWAVRGLRSRHAFVGGGLTGWVFFTAVFWWVNIAMTTFGGMPHAASIPALLALSAWCAFHWAVAFFAVRLLERVHGWPMGLTVAPVWMATELLRNYLFSGFPWANLGYSQMRNLWLSQVGSLLGVYGIALLVALVNGALFEGLRALRRERAMPRWLLGGALGALLAGHLYGAVRVSVWDRAIARADSIQVAVVQGNIDQKLKNVQGGRWRMILDAYNPATHAADDAGADLIVWPEAAFPLGFPKGTSSVDERLLGRSAFRAHLLLGVDLFDPANRRHGNQNASFLLDPDRQVIGEYAKHHLVPFGEYVLFDLDKYLPIDNLVPGTFVPGAHLDPLVFPVRTASGTREAKVGVTICFDAIFPEISRTYARGGAELLVNMTNDAWYGFSSAPHQFLRIVALRAIETGRPVARAANTGISAFIDPLGRIHDPTSIGLVKTDEGSVDAELRVPAEWRMRSLPLMSRATLYVVIGDAPAYLAAAFSLWAVGFAFWRRRRGGQQASLRPGAQKRRDDGNGRAGEAARAEGAADGAPGASLTSTGSDRGSR